MNPEAPTQLATASQFTREQSHCVELQAFGERDCAHSVRCSANRSLRSRLSWASRSADNQSSTFGSCG
jgi:hypothetical protein